MMRLLHAEWTKFRTVRAWVAGLVAVVLVILGLGVMFASGSRTTCSQGSVEVACPDPPLGPDGEPVNDKLYLVGQRLTGDGTITARVTSMTGVITYPPPDHDKIVPGLEDWAKAGVIIKQSTKQGSPYAAVMLTARHGVRMQHNYTHDTPGSASARWIRLTRTGELLTGYESADGNSWKQVGTARLPGLPATVEAGLFVNTPGDLTIEPSTLGGSTEQMRLATATAVFDNVSLRGGGGQWASADIGVTMNLDGTPHHPGQLTRSADTFTLSGNGDIWAMGALEGGQSIERTLIGVVAGLLVVIGVAVTFFTAEYRRGLFRTTLLAGPRRGRAVAAKAVVIGVVTFAAGLVAAVATVPVSVAILRSTGNYVMPVSAAVQVRVVVGTAALLALTAVFAFALGVLFRRGAPAVIVAIVAIFVPYLLATVSVLPDEAARWLMRVTPAAGFAIQQSVPEYPQVVAHYAPATGYFPLAPWAGLGVTCAYAATALGLALHRVRVRDA